MTSPHIRRFAAGAAAAAVAALGIAVAAPAAQADPIPFDVQADAYSNADSWYAGGDYAGEVQSGYFYANPLLDGDEPIADFRATLSVPHDLGIELSTEDEHCTSDGDAIICDYVDSYFGAYVEFDLKHDGAIPVGRDVEYTITVIADDYDPHYVYGTWTFAGDDEGGWGTEFDVAHSSYTDVAPGTVLTPDFAFTNNESNSFEGVYLMVYADEGFLDLAAEYSNCGANEWANVICHLPDFTAEAGATYEFDPASPVTVALREDAPGPITYHAWFSVTTDAYVEDIEFFDADQEFGFVESDRDSVEGWGLVEVESASNPYDLAVNGGSSDEFNKVLTLQIDNLGPATAFSRQHPGSGDGSFTVSVQLPTGMTLGETEDGFLDGDSWVCAEIAAVEWFRDLDPAIFGVERLDIQCWYRGTVTTEEPVLINLPITVDPDAPAAEDGLVVAGLDTTGWDFSDFEENWPGLTEDDYPVLDADLSNNTAVLSITAEGGSEPLPVTGSALTAVVASAAGALIAGVIAFVVLRRRKAAANW